MDLLLDIYDDKRAADLTALGYQTTGRRNVIVKEYDGLTANDCTGPGPCRAACDKDAGNGKKLYIIFSEA